ncbi:hypothetical protein EOA13_31410 [Mesorhizobium sp. M7A.F.Ca.US.011.01.1.1]|uniref:hypothetical protein n=1 Tax=Mesorhizobium sp. M7A.F.Ca.US.011.01.1.1 TaxID=2496741 RepID=UPI000FCBF25F|nr:hypothetical protein [Mesorhizobium sp. M7A.F.Ca.US.011.01.1.1]RUX24202.1 hypothetical protein EOA13_31410 [Mesorhizobium sp. M7A.F.Ca.US.011.01.1.1]
MTSLQTDDHAACCDSSKVEIGLRFIQDTPRHLRGPAIPALRGLGLTAREACEAVRQHNLAMARAG